MPLLPLPPWLLPTLYTLTVGGLNSAAQDRLDSLLKSLAKDNSVPHYLDSSVNDLARAKQPDKEGACALPQGAIGELDVTKINKSPSIVRLVHQLLC